MHMCCTAPPLQVRNASIQAKTTVEVVVLLAETFRRMLEDPLVLADNPELAREIQEAKVHSAPISHNPQPQKCCPHIKTHRPP